MAFVFNGVTIPENVANAFSFNGVDITDVYADGVHVWNQSLINISGFSAAAIVNGTSSPVELQVSGNLFRPNGAGAWCAVDTLGVFSGTASGTWYGLTTSGNTFSSSSGNITLNPSTKALTGISSMPAYGTIETSGGLLRLKWVYAGTFYSNFISMT